MDRKEVEAVLGHEVSHVANGDMVTLTLLQGVLNTFVIFFAHIIGGIIDSALRSRDDRGGRGFGYYAAVLFCELVLGILATVIVAWFSRRREYRADRGGATLEGKQAMASALRRLGRKEEGSTLPESLAAFGVSGRGGLIGLLRTHPPIEERIRALEALPSVR
jgi:heat shock protein HtpX